VEARDGGDTGDTVVDIQADEYMTPIDAIRDGEELPVFVNGQTCILSWHSSNTVPEGTPHGSAAVCITDQGHFLVVSSNGIDWDLPGGRPEIDETWEQTMRREVLEEACATVAKARLLGFARSHCVEGAEAGLVLVRSFWCAQVVLNAWEPAFETIQRRSIMAVDAFRYLPQVFAPIFRRVLMEAGV
jgi:ADP-ribose pyrophosphatase YjhB (NUDIX family)